MLTRCLSEDGEVRRLVDQRTLYLGPEVCVGPMACNHSSNETVDVTVSDGRKCELTET